MHEFENKFKINCTPKCKNIKITIKWKHEPDDGTKVKK